MRKLLASGAALAILFAFAGCSQNSADEKPLNPPSTVNNNAPEAASAGAAPPITDTPTPGEARLGGKKMTAPTGGGAAAPPPSANN